MHRLRSFVDWQFYVCTRTHLMNVDQGSKQGAGWRKSGVPL
jgi:hypothetical protein